MDLEQFFEAESEKRPGLAERFARDEAELRLAMATARCREAQGLTQKAVAERMGVSQSVVGRFEVAGRTPSLETLWKLAAALQVQFVIGPNYEARVEPCVSECGQAERVPAAPTAPR